MTQIATPAFAGATSSKFGGFVEHNTRTTSDLQDLADPRFHRQIEHLHRLGPRVFGELLAEIAAVTGEPGLIADRVAAYARLDPGIVRAVGADRFPPRLLCAVRLNDEVPV